jgi:hypothetical protein
MEIRSTAKGTQGSLLSPPFCSLHTHPLPLFCCRRMKTNKLCRENPISHTQTKDLRTAISAPSPPAAASPAAGLRVCAMPS